MHLFRMYVHLAYIIMIIDAVDFTVIDDSTTPASLPATLQTNSPTSESTHSCIDCS